AAASDVEHGQSDAGRSHDAVRPALLAGSNIRRSERGRQHRLRDEPGRGPARARPEMTLRAQRPLELLFAQVLLSCNSSAIAPTDASIADAGASDAATDTLEADAFDPCVPQQVQID